MKKLLLSLLAFLTLSFGIRAQCFNPVWTEPSFRPMLIYVSSATLLGINLQVGDEIGVFDGDICVGAAVLSEELSGVPVYLVIEASRFHSQRLGFIPGNTITYRFCSGGELVNQAVIPTYTSNGPTFVADDSCVVELHAINNAPNFLSIPDTLATEDEPYSVTITAMDMDGDSVIYLAPVLPGWMSFNDSTHVLSGTPGNSDVGDNHVLLQITDGIANVILDFVVTVENVNDPPAVTSVPLTEARPGSAYSYTVTAVDIDGDALSYAAIVLPGWLSFNPTTHTLSATPGEGDVGDQHVSIRISDGTVNVYHTFIISVSYANHAPTFTSDPAISAMVGDPYSYVIAAQDIDGDQLSYSAPFLPNWLTYQDADHRISGIPGTNDIGRHEVTVRVSDGIVSADQNFHIDVEDVNRAPVFTSVPVTSVTAGQLYVYYAEAEDADDDELVYSAPDLPAWLNFLNNTRILYGTPTNKDAGNHQVKLQVTDGKGSDEQSFVISVEFVAALEELFSRDGISIYPNPTDGRFFIEFSRVLETEINLEIISPLGKVLQKETFAPLELIRREYDLQNWPAGTYYIRIFDDSFQSTWKLQHY